MKLGQVRYFLAVCLHFIGTSLSDNINFVLGFMSSSYGVPPGFNLFTYNNLGAALPLALSDAKNISMFSAFFNNYSITYVMQPTGCSSKVSLAGLVTLQQQWQIAGVIGPDCSPALLSAGLLASAWNIPLVSFSSQALEVSDKSVYNTVVRSNPSYGLFANPILNLCFRYNWTTVGILVTDPLGIASTTLQALTTKLTFYNITFSQESFGMTSYAMANRALQRLSNMSRGRFLCNHNIICGYSLIHVIHKAYVTRAKNVRKFLSKFLQLCIDVILLVDARANCM